MLKEIKAWEYDDLETIDGQKLCLVKEYHIDKIEGVNNKRW